jgi:hypothetical protein
MFNLKLAFEPKPHITSQVPTTKTTIISDYFAISS